ncbi:alpha/beta hydrolase [Xylanimonas sp. McL0601]|uniref:alpha/beta hydrolase n=1 Tax=Xylanimonas sp. McL0601 TaxID=3414739 RepID=UPI003CF594AC
MRQTVVFIHGLWIAKQAWQPWQDLFEAAGYDTLAPGYPGEADTIAATRADPDAQAGHGIDELVEHYAEIIAELPAKPIAVGHSFGGLIAEKLLGQDRVAAAVAIDPAPMKGVKPLPFSQLRSAFPVLSNPSNKDRAKALTADQFHYAFGNALPRAESDALWEEWAIPAPGRPLFQAASANFAKNSPAAVDVANDQRGPLLMISGTADHTVPDVVTRAAYTLYAHSDASTELLRLEGRGHSLTIDHGWREVADSVLAWLGAEVPAA